MQSLYDEHSHPTSQIHLHKQLLSDAIQVYERIYSLSDQTAHSTAPRRSIRRPPSSTPSHTTTSPVVRVSHLHRPLPSRPSHYCSDSFASSNPHHVLLVDPQYHARSPRRKDRRSRSTGIQDRPPCPATWSGRGTDQERARRVELHRYVRTRDLTVTST